MLGNEMFKFPEGVVSRWASYENPDGAKGAGGKERNGRKGAAWFTLNPGEEFVLAHAENTSGVIRRIWITINDQTPETLRGLKLEMFWDGCDKPAVSVPFGDFFCVGLGKVATFKNALFSNPEGRNFSTYIPMPFKTGMKITVTNESSVLIKHFYYDIDYTLGDKFTEDTLYFHAYFNRENFTNLKKDFELLPYVEGKGRYLGTNMGVRCNTKLYSDTWWGEGEFKAYIDGDVQRARNQQQVLQAMFKKATSPEIITKYTSLLKALTHAFDTNMSTKEITSFIKYQIQAKPSWKFEQYVLKGDNDLQVSPELGSEVSVIQLYPSSIHTAAEKIQAVLDGKSSETVETEEDIPAGTLSQEEIEAQIQQGLLTEIDENEEGSDIYYGTSN